MGAKSNVDEIAVETAVETAVLLAEGLSGEDPEAHLSWSNTEHVPEATRAARGKLARARVPHESQAGLPRPKTRRNPVDLLERQAATRIPELVPIRHGRMLVSPFTYYRGAALPMAADLATTPDAGQTVQLSGDAHLLNFGIFGSGERHLYFDANDFDETAPGPWEWDVKRLAASLEVAGRDNEFTEKECSKIVKAAVRSYRKTMHELARMSMLEVWYTHLDLDDLLPRFRSALDPKKTASVYKAIANARAHDSIRAFDKLCRKVENQPRIISDPPLIIPVEELAGVLDPASIVSAMHEIIQSYRRTLLPHRRHLLSQYRVAHLARKVVGVGSVGTDCWIALLLDRNIGTPLFLQIKQAQASVLEEFTSPSAFSHQGHRVVAGQRLMQATTDILLGWDRFGWDGSVRDGYVRQLRDWKGSAEIRGMTPASMSLWGRMCGWSIARAHARSGDRIAIAAYLGKSDVFDRAVVDFASVYADQNERDYLMLQEAVTSGRLAASSL